MHKQFAFNPPINETNYNNYLKLASVVAPQQQQQLKQVYGSNSESSNKVIDYSNKRIAVESLKYAASPSTNTSSNQTLA